jgi:transcriptional regulator with XRE-family HTH domain
MNLALKIKILQIYGTQSDFAQQIGSDDSFVSRIIRERRKLDPIKQEKWAEALGCEPSELFQAE